ncbi:MAG TPA: tetraacyldisaccharide 4'-kinase [Candidatus Angelobacter sp.]|nr:tetraacyldisaccharide 4'-kinase [Candidatus Angelobacter sp.]
MNASPFLTPLLWPFSILYGWIARFRAWLYQKGLLKPKRLKASVISVGNLTAGGTGKTPMVIWLAEKLLAEGKRVAILTRGYRGKKGTSDEIELMKYRLQNRVLFGVGKNRFAEGKKLETRQPIDVFLLDDGFQHLALARDLDILLLDASRSLQGEALLPAGRLREPVSAMSRANVIVFTRTGSMQGSREAIEKLSQLPVFAATTRLLGFRRFGSDVHLQSIEEIGSGPVFAFCGLGNPDAFFRDARDWGLSICGQAVFPDHHRYTARDVVAIKQAGKKVGAKAFVTTEKDAQNLSTTHLDDITVYVCAIEFEVSPENDFRDILNQTVSAGGVAAA